MTSKPKGLAKIWRAIKRPFHRILGKGIINLGKYDYDKLDVKFPEDNLQKAKMLVDFANTSSGRGNPTSAIDASNELIEWAEWLPNEQRRPVTTPACRPQCAA